MPTIYLAFSSFARETCGLVDMHYNPKPENQRGKRQTLKMLFSLWRSLIALELTFNDLHIRKMKCSVEFVYGLAFQTLQELVVAINNITHFN